MIPQNHPLDSLKTLYEESDKYSDLVASVSPFEQIRKDLLTIR